jgi:hypothetical protein
MLERLPRTAQAQRPASGADQALDVALLSCWWSAEPSDPPAAGWRPCSQLRSFGEPSAANARLVEVVIKPGSRASQPLHRQARVGCLR